MSTATDNFNSPVGGTVWTKNGGCCPHVGGDFSHFEGSCHITFAGDIQVLPLGLNP
jgi:hypothetical protein